MSTATKPSTINERHVILMSHQWSIDRLRAKQASWRFRLFAPWWEREAVEHALTVLRREVGRMPSP